MKSESGNREWLDEFMLLKQVSPLNPFTVPPGYFDESAKQIISAIKLEELKAGNGFTMPQNYFDELNNNIQSSINLEEFKAENGFAVPKDYFDELSNNIQSRINIEAYVNTEAHGHAIPQDYFANLEEQVNARIFVEEALNQTESFTVPADYFDKLNQAVLNKTVKQEIVKRKKQGIVRRMYETNTFKYAAAACFMVMVGTGLIITNLATPTEHANTFLHKQLSTVPTSDIQSYLQDNVDANDVQHTVIDENAPVNTNSLNDALQGNNDSTN